MENLSYLAAAYFVIWGLLGIYMVSLHFRLRRLERDIEDLKQEP